MWGKRKVTRIDSLIGQQTEIKGEIYFSGGLHIDGKIEGNIIALNTAPGAVLTLSEQGQIKGEVRVPNVILNGEVIGNVYAEEHIELALNARVIGNVYYNLIEMAILPQKVPRSILVEFNFFHRKCDIFSFRQKCTGLHPKVNSFLLRQANRQNCRFVVYLKKHETLSILKDIVLLANN